MSLNIETTQGLERRVTITVPAEAVEKATREEFKRAAKNVFIGKRKNFRSPYKKTPSIKLINAFLSVIFCAAAQRQDFSRPCSGFRCTFRSLFKIPL